MITILIGLMMSGNAATVACRAAARPLATLKDRTPVGGFLVEEALTALEKIRAASADPEPQRLNTPGDRFDVARWIRRAESDCPEVRRQILRHLIDAQAPELETRVRQQVKAEVAASQTSTILWSMIKIVSVEYALDQKLWDIQSKRRAELAELHREAKLQVDQFRERHPELSTPETKITQALAREEINIARAIDSKLEAFVAKL